MTGSSTGYVVPGSSRLGPRYETGIKKVIFNIHWIYDVNNNMTAWKSLQFISLHCFTGREGMEAKARNHTAITLQNDTHCRLQNTSLYAPNRIRLPSEDSYSHKRCFVCYTSHNFAVVLGRVGGIPPSHSEAPGFQPYPRQQMLWLRFISFCTSTIQFAY